ncbi:MAG: amylo-alpha-1,6-glucosidase [Candidatus Woesearchaeota archaeon]
MGYVEKAGIVLGNSQGGFAWLCHASESRYNGVFFRLGGKVFKTIADFSLGLPLRSVTNHLWGVRRDYDGVSQRLVMPRGTNSLIVEFSSPAKMDLLLDCKLIDDNREWGRYYEVKKEKDCIVVSYRKKNDSRDNSDDKSEYAVYLAIAGRSDFSLMQNWVEQKYTYDESRNSPPYSRWVFNAGSLTGQKFVVSAALSKAKAVSEAKKVLKSCSAFISRQAGCVAKSCKVKAPMPKRISLAYQCACSALDSLCVGDSGLYAGIPWFYQFWVRDEAVSAYALRIVGKKDLAKNILKRHLSSFSKKQLPLAYGAHSLRTADGPGWVALRYFQNADLFSKPEQKKCLVYLKNAFGVIKKSLNNGLVVNGPLETWMDTAVGTDTREGARIEIQALALSLAKGLGETEFCQTLEQRVRETFWNGSYLYDGLNDATIRPNVFIAAYAYPELLSREQWEKCFDTVLPKLWLPWGGLSSIDTSSELFTDHYTGQDNVSYHRGDSWFWLNNLAALVLYRTNAAKYKHFIEKIVEASSHEILELGAIGHHAELSSARALSSNGCVSQAWSSAMFIELCSELF